MTIRELRTWATSEMELPLSETLMLLAHTLSLRKEDLFNDGVNVSESDQQRFKEHVHKRLTGVPMAYIRNKKEFYGADFYVDSRVLIPRPETEQIIDVLLDRIERDSVSAEGLVIADIGTGSGALALSLARVLPSSIVHATDVSDDALAVATLNCRTHQLDSRVTFYLGDLLSPLISAQIVPDIIVANLPYISLLDTQNVALDVHAHEPHLALYSGNSGLEHYERLFEQMTLLRQPPRYVIGEFGAGQSASLNELLAHFSLSSVNSSDSSPVSIFNDLAGIPRVFLISLPR